MMNETLMVVFPSRGALVDATAIIRDTPHVKIKHSAIIAKAEDGETEVYEDDISASEGGVAGGTLGTLMGALGIAQLGAFLLPGVGPILAIGAGALVGGLVGASTGSLTAGFIDLGIDNERLDQLANNLQAGRVALVMQLEGEPVNVAEFENQLQPYSPVITRVGKS